MLHYRIHHTQPQACDELRFISIAFRSENDVLRGATGEISNFYNLSDRLLIFNTHIPPVINTHTS